MDYVIHSKNIYLKGQGENDLSWSSALFILIAFHHGDGSCRGKNMER